MKTIIQRLGLTILVIMAFQTVCYGKRAMVTCKDFVFSDSKGNYIKIDSFHVNLSTDSITTLHSIVPSNNLVQEDRSILKEIIIPLIVLVLCLCYCIVLGFYAWGKFKNAKKAEIALMFLYVLNIVACAIVVVLVIIGVELKFTVTQGLLLPSLFVFLFGHQLKLMADLKNRGKRQPKNKEDTEKKVKG